MAKRFRFRTTSSPGEIWKVFNLMAGALPVGALTGALFGLMAHRLEPKPG